MTSTQREQPRRTESDWDHWFMDLLQHLLMQNYDHAAHLLSCSKLEDDDLEDDNERMLMRRMFNSPAVAQFAPRLWPLMKTEIMPQGYSVWLDFLRSCGWKFN